MSTRVLIVDDSPILRFAMRRAVSQAGVDPSCIFQAGNGQEALDLLSEQPVELILLDIHMPVMDGEEFARRLSEEGRMGDMMVVVVSTESNQERLARLYELGVDGYLHKPFEPEELRRMTGSLLKDAS